MKTVNIINDINAVNGEHRLWHFDEISFPCKSFFYYFNFFILYCFTIRFHVSMDSIIGKIYATESLTTGIKFPYANYKYL